MNYTITNAPLASDNSDCLIVAIFADGTLSHSAKVLDNISGGRISEVVSRGDISGKTGSSLLLLDLPNISSPRVLLIGAGTQDALDDAKFIRIVTALRGLLLKKSIKSVTNTVTEIAVGERDLAWKIQHSIITLDNAAYAYTETKPSAKSDDAAKNTDRTMQFFADDTAASETLEKAIAQGKAIANGMQIARNLGDLPGNVCTPTFLADQAISLGNKHANLNTTILEEAEMAELGMHSLLSVSRGSRQPAKLIVMNYQGAGDDKPVVLVGKGLTFDAGGISLKPGAGMDEMKYDMCGSASVFGTLSACAELGLPINVIGVIPSSENMPDGDANKPGDVVTSMAGHTIEILNTDAEGRLILCDALTYSERFDPAVVIDIATLTGAIIVALGHQTTGLMSNNQPLADALLQASRDSADKAWQLPLWDEYQSQLDSNFADMGNIGGKGAGSITAACFLSRFTQKFEWAHLDIAGTAWKSGGANKGATGRPVPMLMQFLLNRL